VYRDLKIYFIGQLTKMGIISFLTNKSEWSSILIGLEGSYLICVETKVVG
jgi:hypothetical protein